MTSQTEAESSPKVAQPAPPGNPEKGKASSETRAFFGRYRLIMLSAYLGLVAVSLVVFWAVLSARQQAEIDLVRERLKEHVLVVDVLAKIGSDAAASVARNLSVQLSTSSQKTSTSKAEAGAASSWTSVAGDNDTRFSMQAGFGKLAEQQPLRISGPNWQTVWRDQQNRLEVLRLNAFAIGRAAPGLANLAFISKEGLVASWLGKFGSDASDLRGQVQDVLSQAGPKRNPTGSVVVLTPRSSGSANVNYQSIRFLAPVTGPKGFLGVALAGFSPHDLNRVHRNFFIEDGQTFALSRENRVLGLPGEAQEEAADNNRQVVTLENAAFLSKRQREVIAARSELPTGEMITKLGDGSVYFFQGLTFAPWSVVYVGSLDAIRSALFLETGLLVGSLLAALTLLLVIANKLTRREFIDPTYALVEHLRRGGKVKEGASEAESKAAPIPDGWRPFFETVTQVFEENSKAVSLRQELETASEMQASILPDPLPDHANLQLFAVSRPAKEMGGDFYDYFPIGENRLGFVIADVSGKGMPAAIFMVLARTLMKATASNGAPPEEILARVNKLLEQENKALMFVTLFYGILDIPSGKIVYANGGHNPPYVIRKDGSVAALPLSEGMALGVFEEAEFDQGQLQLEPGDQMFLYTDGITEAFSAATEEYGEPRLEASLVKLSASADHLEIRSVRDFTQAVVADVDLFATGADQFDDITCLTLRIPQSARLERAL